MFALKRSGCQTAAVNAQSFAGKVESVRRRLRDGADRARHSRADAGNRDD